MAYMDESIAYKMSYWGEQMANQSVQKQGLAKIIEAEIVAVIDASIGKYRVKYQDATFNATAENIGVQLKRKDRVLVSIPENDLSNPNKIITGLITRKGSHYSPLTETDVLYDTLGQNLYKGSKAIEVSSWQKVNRKENETEDKIPFVIKDAFLSEKEVKAYIESASHLMMKFKLKTDFSPEQLQKNFGIEIVLEYQSETSAETFDRIYRFEPQHIVGSSVYNIKYYTEQSIVFELEESAKFFKRIKSAGIFLEDGFKKVVNPITDIFIKDLEFYALNSITDSVQEGYHVSLEAPMGAFFVKDENNKSQELKLNAKVYLKGILVNPNEQRIKYYWFAEDLTVTSASLEYLKYGKEGWACINTFVDCVEDEAILAGEEEKSEPKITRSYDPGDSSIMIHEDLVQANKRKFKCVIVCDDIVISSNPLTITNEDEKWNLKITSSQGTALRTGQSTDLTCHTKKSSQDQENFTFSYIWRAVDLNEQVSTYSNTGNVLKIQAAEIEKSRVYKCGVRVNDQYVGTAEITLTNEQAAADYTLAIKNGNQIFKYDVNGASPVSRRNETPGYLEELGFVIYDKKGQELTSEAIDIGLAWNQDEDTSSPNINWFVPADDTFLEAIPDGEIKGREKDENGNEIADGALIDILPDITNGCYKFHKKDLVFKIKDSYNSKYSRNQIKLTVLFQPNDKKEPQELIAYTEFVFTKEGALGTNGTGATCWIVDAEDKTGDKRYLEIDNKESNKIYFTNIQDDNGGTELTRFIPKTYPEISKENQFDEFQWSSLYRKQNELSNFYYEFIPKGTNSTDIIKAYFDFNAVDKNKKSWYNESIQKFNPVFANFIQLKVKINDKYCYSVMPLIGVKYTNTGKDNNWEVHYKENSGFLSVLYETNGKYPKYDEDNPFELEILKDSKTLKDTEYDVVWYCSNNLKENSKYNEKLAKNQKRFKPVENYDSYSYANVVYARIHQINKDNSKNLVAEIYIPIYFYINKYFNADINEWDGNGIEIKEDSGIVLSPQVGAGSKDKDNAFTGVIIGTKEIYNTDGVKKPETGLFGYNKGTQTIFLDAQSGKSEFGSNGKGQIIIDPSNQKAQIYSGDYYLRNNINQEILYDEEGNPIEANKGMLIDLSTPEIKFGTGNFHVTSDGHITAKGGGTIAGWKINNHAIFSADGKTSFNQTSHQDSKIGISSEQTTNPKKRTVKTPSNPDGIEKTLAFWAGSMLNGEINKDSFFVAHDGYLKAEEATIGSGFNPIFIGKSENNSAIFTQNKTSLNSNASGFYLGVNGIALGGTRKNPLDSNENISKFQVRNDGTLYATEGAIGDFQLTNQCIRSLDKSVGMGNTLDAFWAGWTEENGYRFHVNKNGKVTCKDLSVTGGSISIKSKATESDGTTPKYSFYVGTNGDLTARNGSFHGTVTATSGKIGGWSINGGNLNSGNMWINNGGSMSGPNWSITKEGLATFNNISITGGTVAGGTVGKGIAGGNINSGSIPWNRGNAWDDVVNKIIEGNLIVKGKLSANYFESENGAQVKYINVKDSAYIPVKTTFLTGTGWTGSPSLEMYIDSEIDRRISDAIYDHIQRYH